MTAESRDFTAQAIGSALRRIEQRDAKLRTRLALVWTEREAERTGSFRGAINPQQRRAGYQLRLLNGEGNQWPI